MKIDYEVIDIEEYETSTNFKIVYEIKEGDKILKKGFLTYADNNAEAYMPVDYDENRNPIPKWRKHVNEILKMTLENFERKYYGKKHEFEELKPKIGEKFTLEVKRAIETETKDDDLKILIKLPKVGLDIAKALLDKFGNIGNIINATKEELIEVSGIGKVNVEEIYDALQKLKGE